MVKCLPSRDHSDYGLRQKGSLQKVSFVWNAHGLCVTQMSQLTKRILWFFQGPPNSSLFLAHVKSIWMFLDIKPQGPSAFHTTHITSIHVPTAKELQGSLGNNLAIYPTGRESRLGRILNHMAVGGEGTLYPKIEFLPNWQGRASSWFIRFEEINKSDISNTPGHLGKDATCHCLYFMIHQPCVAPISTPCCEGWRAWFVNTASHLPPCSGPLNEFVDYTFKLISFTPWNVINKLCFLELQL